MSIVTLVSGGLDSTLMAVLVNEEGLSQHPLFVDYGQLCREREWDTCTKLFTKLKLPKPVRMDVSGYGKTISSGLTDSRKRTNEDAFLPGRNLMFVLLGSALAYQTNSNAVCIGLLSEETHIFPDQTRDFLDKTQGLIGLATGRKITIIAPLMDYFKADILQLARDKKITGTYSCHAGTDPPCGQCISCLEIDGARPKRKKKGA